MDKKLRKILKLYSSRDTLSLKDVGLIWNKGISQYSRDVSYLVRQGYLEVEPNYAILHKLPEYEIA